MCDDYKPCGINGCILVEKHAGPCAIDFLTAPRQRKQVVDLAPKPERVSSGPKEPKEPKAPRVLPGAPERWRDVEGFTIEGHIEEDVWEVEEIVDVRVRKKRKEYRVRWEGWVAKDDTWEPAKDILDRSLIDDFEALSPEERAEIRPPPLSWEQAREACVVRCHRAGLAAGLW